MPALKKAVKKQLGEVWLRRFPTFVHWKPGHLVRRHGPLLVGICMEPAGNERQYQPIFHIHCLGIPFNGISLSLFGPLRGRFSVPEDVPCNLDDMRMRNVLERFAEQYPAVEQIEFGFNDYIRATRYYLSHCMGVMLENLNPYQDVLTTAASLRLKEYVVRNVQKHLDRSSSWPEAAFQVVGGRDAWQRRMIELAEHPELVDATVSSEVNRHGLDGVPDQRLIINADLTEL